MSFGSIFSVVLVVISLLQLQSTLGFKYTNCGERVFYIYDQQNPLGVEINGIINITYLSAPFGDFMRFETAVINDKIIEIGVAEVSDSLHGIPTSDDIGRIDRQSFYVSGGSAPGYLTAALPITANPVDAPTYTSLYIISQNEVNDKPILNWAAGDEWQVDYTGICEDFQGYFLEVQCQEGGIQYCTKNENTVTEGDFGSIGSGNALQNQLTKNLDCSNAVSFAGSDSSKTKIALTVYIDFQEGDSLKIYDGADASATLLKEYTDADIPYTQDVIYTTQPDNFFVEFSTDTNRKTDRGNGYSIVYERQGVTPAAQCFSPSTGCDQQCLNDFVCSYDIAFGYLIDPNFDFGSCCAGTYSEECVLAAYTVNSVGICDGRAKRSMEETSVFLNKPKNLAQSTDKSKLKNHMRMLKQQTA